MKLDNLLCNAADHSAAESSITLSIEEGADDILLGIQDQGVGISDKDLERVFARYYKGSAKRSDSIAAVSARRSARRSPVSMPAGSGPKVRGRTKRGRV